MAAYGDAMADEETRGAEEVVIQQGGEQPIGVSGITPHGSAKPEYALNADPGFSVLAAVISGLGGPEAASERVVGSSGGPSERAQALRRTANGAGRATGCRLDVVTPVVRKVPVFVRVKAMQAAKSSLSGARFASRGCDSRFAAWCMAVHNSAVQLEELAEGCLNRRGIGLMGAGALMVANALFWIVATGPSYICSRQETYCASLAAVEIEEGRTSYITSEYVVSDWDRTTPEFKVFARSRVTKHVETCFEQIARLSLRVAVVVTVFSLGAWVVAHSATGPVGQVVSCAMIFLPIFLISGALIMAASLRCALPSIGVYCVPAIIAGEFPRFGRLIGCGTKRRNSRTEKKLVRARSLAEALIRENEMQNRPPISNRSRAFMLKVLRAASEGKNGKPWSCASAEKNLLEKALLEEVSIAAAIWSECIVTMVITVAPIPLMMWTAACDVTVGVSKLWEMVTKAGSRLLGRGHVAANPTVEAIKSMRIDSRAYADLTLDMREELRAATAASYIRACSTKSFVVSSHGLSNAVCRGTLIRVYAVLGVDDVWFGECEGI